MTLSLDGGVVLLGLLVPVALLAAFVSVPRWFTRSMGKHALWRLRDEVVDDVIAGDLPADDDAIQELIARIHWAIRESRSFDLLHLVVWSRAKRAVPEKTLCELVVVPDLRQLSDEQTSKVVSYRKRYDSVATGAILLSSWLGVTVVLWTALRLALRAIRRQIARTHEIRAGALVIAAPPIRLVVREATDEAATETWLGRRAQDFVKAKGPAFETEPVPILTPA